VLYLKFVFTGSGDLTNHAANLINHKVRYLTGPFCATVFSSESDISAFLDSVCYNKCLTRL